jgi:hypothetical protein
MTRRWRRLHATDERAHAGTGEAGAVARAELAPSLEGRGAVAGPQAPVAAPSAQGRPAALSARDSRQRGKRTVNAVPRAELDCTRIVPPPRAQRATRRPREAPPLDSAPRGPGIIPGRPPNSEPVVRTLSMLVALTPPLAIHPCRASRRSGDWAYRSRREHARCGRDVHGLAPLEASG